MKLPFWPFSRAKRRHAKYCLNVHKDLPLADLILILRAHTPVISARELNRLPATLRGYFVKMGAK